MTAAVRAPEKSYRDIALADLVAGRAPGESVAHWERRVRALVKIIERHPA